PALGRLARLYGKQERIAEAMDLYQKACAASPRDANFLHGYAAMLAVQSPGQALDVLKGALSQAWWTERQRVELTFLAAHFAEEIGRSAHGLPAGWAESADDLEPRFAAAEVAALRDLAKAWADHCPEMSDPWRYLGVASLILNDGADVESHFRMSRLGGTPTISDIISFDPEFYMQLSSKTPTEIA